METKKTTPLVWVGRVLSTLPLLGLTMSAMMKLSHNKAVVDGMVGHGGYPEGSILPIGVVELLCVVLMAVPQTSIFGAILATGYLGGAVATHVRGGEGFAAPIVFGVMIWLGLFFRDQRLQQLVPLRKPEGGAGS